ncbi:hypothetical protein Tco_0858961 [Tanacetum coccineum]|uniref:Reverse transcriptase domain-containing protein n=1 Tax=Tanacetum coccineum TaxID=301880 RepID=A0ABQ5BGA6_9ASTR
MRTRSQSRRRRQQQTLPVVVENFDLEEPIVDQNIVAMADNRTMAQMLQAPIEGYEDAIVVPPINANNFELKQPLINLVQSNKFTGRQDPHNHLRFFNKVTSTFRHPEVPNTSIKLLLFPFSLDGGAELSRCLKNSAAVAIFRPNASRGLAIKKAIKSFDTPISRANDSKLSTDAPLSNSSPSNNSFDMQQIAASLEDKMTIKMKQMMNEMKALVVTTPAPIKAVEKGLEDKILVPKPPRNCARCARCGTPVDGMYCQGCVLLRKKFKEDLFTYCVENEFFKDLQHTSESSDDNTNVVNAPQEPFVGNQDPGENSSPSPLRHKTLC